MKLYDAHCHLHRALPHMAVVNGTQPSDWLKVIKLAEKNAHIIPAIGLHPWRVKDAPSDWQARFLQCITTAQAVGEIGLDQWIDEHDIERQQEAFSWQLRQASLRNLPVSIHCLKATAPLLQILKTHPVPERGIHLHAYSGSAEQVPQFVELGAYLSFHATQLSGTAKKAPASLREVPADRLLIETDAPDSLKNSSNVTSYLQQGYQRVADIRDITLAALVEQVASNFNRYFLND